MSLQNPPRLATWLLNRCGFAHQNPPLAGDLLEEFRGGRSAAWYWRQTLVVISTGLVQNARLFKRLLIANIIGWALQAGVTLVLWRSHHPPELHGIAEGIAAILVTIVVLLLLLLPKMLGPVDGVLSSSEKAQKWNRAEDQDDERLIKWLRRSLLLFFGCVPFAAYLSIYCLAALFDTVSLGDLIGLQTWFLFWTVKDVLVPDANPGTAKIFTTLKQP
jgi:hypothetical protein